MDLIGLAAFTSVGVTAVGGLLWAYASWRKTWPSRMRRGIRYIYEQGAPEWSDLERCIDIISDTYRVEYGDILGAQYSERTFIRIWPEAWGNDPMRPGHGTSGLTFDSNFMGFNSHLTAMVIRRSDLAVNSSLFHEIAWHVLPGIIDHNAATHDVNGNPFPNCEKWGKLEIKMREMYR